MLLFVPACGQASGGEDGPANTNGNAGLSDEKRERIEKAAQGELEADESASKEAASDQEASKNVPLSEGRAPKAPFVHEATGENSRGDFTYLDDPALNGDPDAVVVASPAGAYDHNIGVWYEAGKQRWAIFNQDITPVPSGSKFEVFVPPESERLVHRATEENTSGDTSFIDDPLLNGKPDAEVSVTQNWNPGGGDGVYNDHPVGVRYDAGKERWAVFNGDRTDLPGGAAFNVTVSEQAEREGGEVAKAETGEVPEYRDFFSEEGDPETPAKFVSSGSSAGAIPVVKPFNFGRNPGGPEDKTLSIAIPKIGVEGIPVFDTLSEEKLREGTVHIPATGYPWQEGANVFVAGHRIGFEGTPSYYVFYRLDELREGDEIRLTDAAGREYLYRVTRSKVVGPDNVEVMNAVEGESLITLQTCTLPDYEERLIVQGELVEEQT